MSPTDSSVAPPVTRFRPGAALPSGVYLDVNILLHARDQASQRYRTASACLRELILQDVEVNVSTLVFDELWWGLFKWSYRMLTGHELTGSEYKNNVEVWRRDWPIVQRISNEMLAWKRLRILESHPAVAVVRLAMELVTRNPLAPRDAFHLALALHYNIPGFVTGDSDFDRLRLPIQSRLTIIKI